MGADDTDRQILVGIQAGNALALAELYDRYATCLFSVALTMLRSEPEPHHVAERVIERVFAELWQSAAQSIPTAGPVAATLIGAVRDGALSMRTQPRAPASQSVWSQECELSPLQQAAIELRYLDKWSMVLIAETLNESATTTSRALAEATSIVLAARNVRMSSGQ